MDLVADSHALRSIIIKLQDYLTDDDRQRLHFFLGSDVPKSIRDNPSLTGTLELVESLFEQDKINENDFTFLIDAFDEIRCFDAVKILREYRRQMQQVGQHQSQESLPSILSQESEQTKMNYQNNNMIFNSQRNDCGDNNTLINSNNMIVNQRAIGQTKNRRQFSRSLFKKIKPVFICIFLLVILFTVVGSVFLMKINRLIKNFERKDSIISNSQLNTKDYNQLNKQLLSIQGILQRLSLSMNISTKSIDSYFSQEAQTIVGGINRKHEKIEFSEPTAISIDRNQIIYIVDSDGHFIVQRNPNSTLRKIITRSNHGLYYPTTLVIDEKNHSLIIADKGNKRIVRWYPQMGALLKAIISDISCWGLALDENGYLYISDNGQNEIKQYKLGEKNGLVVAGGNGEGFGLNQFNKPRHIYVDQDQSIYVSDHGNHRVMKWMRGAKEGIIVAGGHGSGESLQQLNSPNGIFVDQLGTVYVADTNNHRIVRWLKGATEGEVVAGGNGYGIRPTQLNQPIDLIFDRQNNLYVLDKGNRRIQSFSKYQ